jgi:hypothetical protein
VRHFRILLVCLAVRVIAQCTNQPSLTIIKATLSTLPEVARGGEGNNAVLQQQEIIMTLSPKKTRISLTSIISAYCDPGCR